MMEEYPPPPFAEALIVDKDGTESTMLLPYPPPLTIERSVTTDCPLCAHDSDPTTLADMETYYLCPGTPAEAPVYKPLREATIDSVRLKAKLDPDMRQRVRDTLRQRIIRRIQSGEFPGMFSDGEGSD